MEPAKREQDWQKQKR